MTLYQPSLITSFYASSNLHRHSSTLPLAQAATSSRGALWLPPVLLSALHITLAVLFVPGFRVCSKTWLGHSCLQQDNKQQHPGWVVGCSSRPPPCCPGYANVHQLYHLPVMHVV
jgi:hypothetical protein